MTIPLISQESSEYKNYISKADSSFKLEDYKNAAKYYSEAFKSFGWKGTETDRYNAARAWTMIDELDSAFYCLNRIVNKAGYSNYEKITTDKYFEKLHADKRWQPIIDQAKRNKLPTGWHRGGNDVTNYQMYLDSGAGKDGKSALSIKSFRSSIDGFGTLMQSFLAEKYSGKRIRLTGYIKSKYVEGWAGLWLRVDKENSKQTLAFDNMQDRGITGTTDWKKYEVVLDVSSEASKIAFGVLLHGIGQVWFEKLKFEVVSKSVPVTGKYKEEPNLNFEK